MLSCKVRGSICGATEDQSRDLEAKVSSLLSQKMGLDGDG
jgi:hypothetical protein